VGKLFKRFNIMKYLVLGSSGQIGAELCKFLKTEGHEVLTFDIEDDSIQDLRIKGICF